MRRVPRRHTNRTPLRERDPRAPARLAVLLACGLVLACGFAYAARQQFAAVRLGYRSEELRRERERLRAEHDRLRYELEKLSNPARLEQEARGMGLRPARPSQIGVDAPARATSPTFVGSASAPRLSR
jgi:cell division protein FtsL